MTATPKPSPTENDLAASAEGDSSISRRGFLGGTVAVGAALTVGGLAGTEVLKAPAAAAATAAPLPATTEPEQLHLTWGSDPSTQVTVSWASPGTVAQPTPTLAYSEQPITAENPGRIVKLPAPTPLDPTELRTRPAALSFIDGGSGQTTYHYHVPLEELRPGTTYYYQVSDGATTPATAGASFTTAAQGRFNYRFSSFGDIQVPSAARNASGLSDSSADTCYFTVNGIEAPGDGGGAPLFHLVNGDLSYANGSATNKPAIWRDYSVNVSRSAMNRPWMPTLGNHEIEGGNTAFSGAPGSVGNWNDTYGHGSYMSRFLLPPNGVTNYDGNKLQGRFWGVQVGTVYFIAIDADDVIYQLSDATPEAIVGYTGSLVSRDSDYSMVPGGSRPNLQTLWLERELRKARLKPSVDMIVVSMHQCPLSTNTGNSGSDMGIRQSWLPLFDKYEVDLVLSGHNHVFERSYPVRGYDNGDFGTVTSAFTTAEGVSYAVGDAFNTRRPTVASTSPTATVNGQEVFDTSQGSAYYVLGGGGAGSTFGFKIDQADGERIAPVYNVPGEKAAQEDAPWSAQVDSGDAHGYAIFDVDAGSKPGETTIAVQWFQMQAVAPGATPVMPTTPYSKATYGRTARWKPKDGKAAII